MSSTHECNPRTVWALGNREVCHHSDHRSTLLVMLLWIRCFCSGARLQTDRAEKQKQRTTQKTRDSRVPQLIYSCVDRTLHLFIVCIYLLGSWISPAVRSHSSAHNCLLLFFEAIGKMLFVCGFYCYHEDDKKTKEVNCYDWTTVPFYQIGCVQKSIWCFQCIHTAFWLFARIPRNQCTHSIMKSRHVVILLLKLHTASKPTVSSTFYLLLKNRRPALVFQPRLLQNYIHIQLNCLLCYVSRGTYFLPNYSFKHLVDVVN